MEINHKELKQKISENDVLVVEFWASWCPPCKMMEPMIKDLAEEYKDNVEIVKINVDKNKNVSDDFGIMGVPTIIVFKDGKEMKRRVGAASKEQIVDFIEA